MAIVKKTNTMQKKIKKMIENQLHSDYLHKSLVHAHLEYCVQLSLLHLIKDITKLEKGEKATAIIIGSSDTSGEKNLKY